MISCFVELHDEDVFASRTLERLSTEARDPGERSGCENVALGVDAGEYEYVRAGSLYPLPECVDKATRVAVTETSEVSAALLDMYASGNGAELFGTVYKGYEEWLEIVNVARAGRGAPSLVVMSKKAFSSMVEDAAGLKIARDTTVGGRPQGTYIMGIVPRAGWQDALRERLFPPQDAQPF